MMSAFVVVVLQRFRRRDKERWKVVSEGELIAGAARDHYDERLDEELRQLDDE